MRSLTRRDILRGAGTAGALFLAGPTPALPRRAARDRIGDLAALLVDTPRERVFEALRGHLTRGLTWQDLGAAVFHAGVLEVRPRPVGFKLHAVMVVEPMFQLAEASPQHERFLPMLWNVDDFKRSQARDDKEGDWRLGPAPRAVFASAEAAQRELTAALAARDAERADRAVVGALGRLPRARVFELLWPVAMGDFQNLGHKPIYCAHVERVLERLDGARAEPALRALVYGLLADDPGPQHAEYLASEELARAFPAGWAAGERAPERSLELARRVLPATPEGARDVVLAALREGLHPDTVWDALRLAAADLFARKPELLPVHPTTATNALRYIARATEVERTRRLALLQAASWLPLYRAALGLAITPGAGLDPLVSERAAPAAVGVEELFAAPTALRARTCLERPGALAPFAAALRTSLFRAAREHHQPKYAAAILEDARSADPRWHPALLASALEYLPAAGAPASDAYTRASALLSSLEHR
jgi:hypothetical protein